jgi:hypothetical protein
MKRCSALIPVAALALLVAACGSSPSSTGSSGAANAGSSASSASVSSRMLPFAQCVRSHGVPDFPDPAGNGKFPTAAELGVGSAQLSAAENACQRLLPAGTGDQFPPAEVPLLLSGMREFSQCMRSHGVPNWPDPITDSEGRPVFDLGAHGITRADTYSTRFQATVADCQHLLPSALGGNTPIGGS